MRLFCVCVRVYVFCFSGVLLPVAGKAPRGADAHMRAGHPRRAAGGFRGQRFAAAPGREQQIDVGDRGGDGGVAGGRGLLGGALRVEDACGARELLSLFGLDSAVYAAAWETQRESVLALEGDGVDAPREGFGCWCKMVFCGALCCCCGVVIRRGFCRGAHKYRMLV